jgi:hypothetical protein
MYPGEKRQDHGCKDFQIKAISSQFATINTNGHGQVTKNAYKHWLKTTIVDPREKIYFTLFTVLTSNF